MKREIKFIFVPALKLQPKMRHENNLLARDLIKYTNYLFAGFTRKAFSGSNLQLFEREGREQL